MSVQSIIRGIDCRGEVVRSSISAGSMESLHAAIDRMAREERVVRVTVDCAVKCIYDDIEFDLEAVLN